MLTSSPTTGALRKGPRAFNVMRVSVLIAAVAAMLLAIQSADAVKLDIRSAPTIVKSKQSVDAIGSEDPIDESMENEDDEGHPVCKACIDGLQLLHKFRPMMNKLARKTVYPVLCDAYVIGEMFKTKSDDAKRLCQKYSPEPVPTPTPTPKPSPSASESGDESGGSSEGGSESSESSGSENSDSGGASESGDTSRTSESGSESGSESSEGSSDQSEGGSESAETKPKAPPKKPKQKVHNAAGDRNHDKIDMGDPLAEHPELYVSNSPHFDPNKMDKYHGFAPTKHGFPSPPGEMPSTVINQPVAPPQAGAAGYHDALAAAQNLILAEMATAMEAEGMSPLETSIMQCAAYQYEKDCNMICRYIGVCTKAEDNCVDEQKDSHCHTLKREMGNAMLSAFPLQYIGNVLNKHVKGETEREALKKLQKEIMPTLERSEELEFTKFAMNPGDTLKSNIEDTCKPVCEREKKEIGIDSN